MIEFTIIAFSLYVLIGVICAIPLAIWGISRIDPTVKESTFWFRCIAVPGCIALWPVMLLKWSRA